MCTSSHGLLKGAETHPEATVLCGYFSAHRVSTGFEGHPKPAVNLLYVAIIAAIVSSHAKAEEKRDHFVNALRHQEQLLWTIKCRYNVVNSPTRPEIVPLIKKICTEQGRANDFKSYVLSADRARMRDSVVHWWRDRDKERIETVFVKTGERTIVGFDGAVVRSVEFRGEQTTGSIRTTETADWRAINRLTPGYLLYWYFDVPYSTVIENAKSCRIWKSASMGDVLYNVVIEHATNPIRIEMVFDDSFRLKQRDILVKFAVDKDLRLNERHRLQDFAELLHESGETVWYPRTADISYYMGVTDDGRPVEYSSKHIEITEFTPNQELSADLFQLSFPQDAVVWEGVHNLGWLDEGIDPENPLATRASAWQVALAVLSGGLLLLFAYVIARRAGWLARAGIG